MDLTPPPENPYEAPRHDVGAGGIDARRRASDSELQTGDWILAVLCSGIGCIMGIIWLVQGKPKGGKMIGISILFSIMWNIVRFAIEAALQNQ